MANVFDELQATRGMICADDQRGKNPGAARARVTPVTFYYVGFGTPTTTTTYLVDCGVPYLCSRRREWSSRRTLDADRARDPTGPVRRRVAAAGGRTRVDEYAVPSRTKRTDT